LLYTSQIGNIASNFNTSLQQYADDTRLFFAATVSTLQVHLTINTLHASLANFELCLTTLYSWLSHNSLTLNGDKSEEIIFCTRQKPHTYTFPLGISIRGTVVSLSDNIKTLGVTLNSHFTLNSNI